MTKSNIDTSQSLPKPLLPLPRFKNRAEESTFWETHDIWLYVDQWDEDRHRLSQGITVRFTRETLKSVRRLAREYGIGPTTLIRAITIEHLKSTKTLLSR